MALKKNNYPNAEYRTVGFTLEKREDDVTGSENNRIEGYAAVFNVVSDAGGWFREQVSPGAFAGAIRRDDVRALYNHNPDFVLGRNRAGTLTLSEDEHGLFVRIDPPDTQYARDLLTSMTRGDTNQMSFAFSPIKQEWDESDPDMPLRTIKEVRLYDVSVVTYPFYEATDAAVRSAYNEYKQERKGEGEQMLHDLYRRKIELIKRG